MGRFFVEEYGFAVFPILGYVFFGDRIVKKLKK